MKDKRTNSSGILDAKQAAATRESKLALESAGCSVGQFLSRSDCCVREILITDRYRDRNRSVIPRWENEEASWIDEKFGRRVWGVSSLWLEWDSLELDQGEECMHAIGASLTCRTLCLSGHRFTTKQISWLCDGLISNQTLQSLFIFSLRKFVSSDHSSDKHHSVQMLLAAVQGHEALESIVLDNVDLESCSRSLEPNALVAVLSLNCKVQSLIIHSCRGLSHSVLTSLATCLQTTGKTFKNLLISPQEAKRLPDEFTRILRFNGALELVGLANFSLTRSQFIEFFKSLEDNASLEVLRMYMGMEFPEDADLMANLLHSLQANGIVRQLKFGPHFLSSASHAAIQAQLERNQSQGEYIKKLKVSTITDLPKVPARTCRVFICGEPYAGKSILCKSLATTGRTRGKHQISCMRFNPDEIFRKRTRGIDITALFKGDLRISLWDMAGQLEFHSFHDHMFPDLSNQASPSFFVFVWNPFEVAANGEELIRRKSRQKFQSELKYWLKFIASKTRSSKLLKPQLIVVLSRKDRVQRGESIRSWLGDSLRHLQQSFKAVIDMEDVFQVDARDPSSVKDVHSCIFRTAENILTSGVPRVYSVCKQVRRGLSDGLRMKYISPLITFSEFKSICKKLGIWSSFGDFYEAIALSLNDSGDLIYLKRMHFVVVDTRWFCHRVMGNLIYYSGPSKSRGPCAGNAEHGFLSSEYLKELLETEFMSMSNDDMCFYNRGKRRSWEPIVKGGDLVELLLGMHLACRKDGDQQDSEIFVPACLPSRDNLQSRWRGNIGDDRAVVYLGRRLKCRDSDLTFITSGVFHLLQVALFNKFSTNAYPEKNSMSVIYDGIEVLVEFCYGSGEDQFIDVLVRSLMDFDSTLKKVHDDVINFIIRICAEPKGIQGVELVEAVVRPSCVNGPSSGKDRRNQDIPIEDLHKRLAKEVEEGNSLKLGCILHSWTGTESFNPTDDDVIALLGEAEVRKWSESHERQWRSAAVALGVLRDERRNEAEVSEGGERSFQKTPSGREREWIFKEVRNARGEIREMRRSVEEIGAEIKGLQKQVVPRLKELATFLRESDDGRVPRMPVVTVATERWGRRVITALVPGLRQVRLELLCENRQQPHLVEEQPGLQFATLDDGLLKQALPFVNAFLKLAYVAVKATAHVAVGLGKIVPDFTLVLASLADTSDISLDPQLDLNTPRYKSRVATKQWLFDILSRHNCLQGAEIHNTFQLRRVRYSDSHIAWVCDTHYFDDIAHPA